MAILITPQIFGTNSIDYGQTNVPYTIGNLDAKATDVLTTPYCLGISSIHDFVNNGDGTGSFQIDFSNSIYVYQLQIRVDDGNHLSDPSNIIIIALFVDVISYGDLHAQPVTYRHNPLYENMIKEMPECSSYNIHNNYTIPYSYHPSTWEVTLPYLGEILYYNFNNTNVKSIVPKGPVAIVELDLPLGTSRVNFDYDGHKLTYSVGRTNLASLISVYAQQIYTSSKKLQTLNGDYLSLLSSGILKVEKYLPNWRQLKNAVKYKAVQGLTSSNYEQVLSSYMGNNYYADKVVLSDYAIENKYSNREHYNGTSIHWWSFLEKIEAWWTFSKVMSQIKSLQGIFTDQTWYESSTFTPTVEHFLQPNVFVDYDLNMKILMDTTHRLIWNLNQKNWDTAYTIEAPLGDRVVLDSGIPWDSGLPFDGTELDPGDDGWVGWSPYDRWDSLNDSDTVTMPQTICQTAQLKSIIAGAFDLGVPFPATELQLIIKVVDNGTTIEMVTYDFPNGTIAWTPEQIINIFNKNDGTGTLTTSGTTLTGTGTVFTNELKAGSKIFCSNEMVTIASITDANNAVLYYPPTIDFTGESFEYQNYSSNYWMIYTDLTERIYIDIVNGSYDLVVSGTAAYEFGWSMGQKGLNSQRAVKCAKYDTGWNLNGTTLIMNTIDSVGAIISTDSVTFIGTDPYSIDLAVTEYNATATSTIAYSKNNDTFCITSINLDEGLKIGTGSSNAILGWDDNEIIEGAKLQSFTPLEWSPATLSSMNLTTPAMKLTFP